MKCKSCQYWRRIEDEDGTCKRYPPVIIDYQDGDLIIGRSVFWNQPITDEDNWCGEWKQG